MRQKCGLSHLTATPQKNLSPLYLADLDAYAGSWHNQKSYSMSKRISEVQTAKHMVEKLPPSDPCHIQLSFHETLSHCSLAAFSCYSSSAEEPPRRQCSQGLPLGLTLLLNRINRRKRPLLSTLVLKHPHCHSDYIRGKFYETGQGPESPLFRSAETLMWQLALVWQQGSDMSTAAWFYKPQESHHIIRARNKWALKQHALAARIRLRPGKKKQM